MQSGRGVVVVVVDFVVVVVVFFVVVVAVKTLNWLHSPASNNDFQTLISG